MTYRQRDEYTFLEVPLQSGREFFDCLLTQSAKIIGTAKEFTSASILGIGSGEELPAIFRTFPNLSQVNAFDMISLTGDKAETQIRDEFFASLGMNIERSRRWDTANICILTKNIAAFQPKAQYHFANIQDPLLAASFSPASNLIVAKNFEVFKCDPKTKAIISGSLPFAQSKLNNLSNGNPEALASWASLLRPGSALLATMYHSLEFEIVARCLQTNLQGRGEFTFLESRIATEKEDQFNVFSDKWGILYQQF